MKLQMRLLAIGVIAVLLLAAGCGSGPTHSSSSIAAAGSASTIYVFEDVSNSSSITESILGLPANGQASVAPTASITTGASFGLAVDQSGNLYSAIPVATPNTTTSEIVEYAPGATGQATPIRTITTSSELTALAVDSSGQIYTFSPSGISVYAANATGYATPIRLIPTRGQNTTLDFYAYASGIAVDSAQNIYVISGGFSILVFSPTANGDVAPTRNITWDSTQYWQAYGIAVDANGTVYTANVGTPSPGPNTPAVLEFAAATSGGSVTPSKILTNLAIPGSGASAYPKGIAVDGAGNVYVQVENATSQSAVMAVDVFSPEATGASAPGQIITSAQWNDTVSVGLAVR